MQREFTETELKWIKSLQRVLNKQPKSIEGFCTGTSINFYTDKLPIVNHGVDGTEDMQSVTNINWEAGAY